MTIEWNQGENKNGTANVRLIKENSDGSAVYEFDLPPEAASALLRLGIITAIQAGIAQAEKFHPDYKAEKNTCEGVLKWQST